MYTLVNIEAFLNWEVGLGGGGGGVFLLSFKHTPGKKCFERSPRLVIIV